MDWVYVIAGMAGELAKSAAQLAAVIVFVLLGQATLAGWLLGRGRK